MKVLWIFCFIFLLYTILVPFLMFKNKKTKNVSLNFYVNTVTAITLVCMSYLLITYFEAAVIPNKHEITSSDNASRNQTTIVEEDSIINVSKRYKFPLEKSSFDFLSETKGALPFVKKVEENLDKLTFEPEKQTELKWNVEVQEDYVVDNTSDICAGKKITINLSSCGSLITCDEQDENVVHLLNPFIIYRISDDDIILEGLTNTRQLYRYTFTQNNLVHIDKGYNVDFPLNSGYEIVGYVNYEGTYTYKEGMLEYWKYGEVVCSLEIPEPQNLSEKLFHNTCFPYLSKDGEIVLPLSCKTARDEYKLRYIVLATDVEKICGYYRNFFLSKDGKYGYIKFLSDYPQHLKGTSYYHDSENVFDEPVETEVVWLTEENVSEVKFVYNISMDYRTNKNKLISCNLAFKLKDNSDYLPFLIKVYTAPEDTYVDEEIIDTLNRPFKPSEYAEKIKWLKETCS